MCHNADTALADSDNCLPLLRVLQCPCMNSVSTLSYDTLSCTTQQHQCHSINLQQHRHIAESPYTDSDRFEGPCDGPCDASKPMFSKPDTLYNLLESFSVRNPQSVQGVLNRHNETAIFYVLRMCIDYGRPQNISCGFFLGP